MANCPKIKYKGTVINTLKAGSTEIYNLNDSTGKRIYHKHVEGVCATHHVGVNEERCQGTIVTCRWNVSAVDDNWIDVYTTCSNGHEGYAVDPNDGREHDRRGSKCNKLLSSTPYDYWTYNCGYESGTTDADITDISDIIFLKPNT